jgi:hypothetical protein
MSVKVTQSGLWVVSQSQNTNVHLSALRTPSMMAVGANYIFFTSLRLTVMLRDQTIASDARSYESATV